MDYLKDLKEQGFLYAIMPKRNRKRFLATKAKMKKGNFKDNDDFCEFTLEPGETWDLEKGIFFKL